jgi:hypothetical protein
MRHVREQAQPDPGRIIRNENLPINVDWSSRIEAIKWVRHRLPKEVVKIIYVHRHDLSLSAQPMI